jgi:hypothetical protein
MAAKDQELEAISRVIAALEPLDDQGRSRVLEYVLKRLQMAAVRAPAPIQETAHTTSASSKTRGVVDIRSLKEEKMPQSLNQMAALVAYYLSELAPEGEKSATINTNVLRRYLKVAGFHLPRDIRYTLINAAAAGYLDKVGGGEYRLNPVGYNLIVHGLPREGGKRAVSPDLSRGIRRKKRKPKKKVTGKVAQKRIKR